MRYRSPSLWEANRTGMIVACVVFLLQAGLIATLLVEYRRRHRAEVANEIQRTELAHASRLAVAGELTASIAHEINQPLGAIVSNADAAEMLLQSGDFADTELGQIVADIRSDSLRASEVIRRLRMLLTRREIKRRAFEINEAVLEVESMLRSEAHRRRVAVDTRVSPEAVSMVGDRIQIQQVLLNLLLNAMDGVRDLPEYRRTVVVSVEKLVRGISISVRDRGRGITAENLPKLFESFFSTKSGGMGLGLSIARTIVEAHGGRIWAENGLGEGAVFHIELPAAAATAVSPSTRVA
jgi:signal transduction histidine kinase